LNSSFLEEKRKHFDLLCTNLGLTAEPQEAGEGFTTVSAVANNVRVFFEEERGLCAFAIGAHSDVKPMCSVEEMASRFPRVRLLPEGHQRLDCTNNDNSLKASGRLCKLCFLPITLQRLGAGTDRRLPPTPKAFRIESDKQR
jgi:hypothetical protein